MLARSQQEVSCRNENWREVGDKSPSSSVNSTSTQSEGPSLILTEAGRTSPRHDASK
jgi:hypothetical protein